MRSAHNPLPWRLGLAAAAVLLVAAIAALALLRKETALQITLAGDQGSLPDGFYLYQRLDERGIRIKSITPAKDGMVILLESPDQAPAALSALRDLLPRDYSISRSRQYPRWIWLYRLDRNMAHLG
ncbi:EnvZ/OmpR regulon moderator MzrA [Martelella alba]|uniref:EnvZ/OmpR regulon moderator MzrA n=1 Tax=Martelella alba TaxID=2590451 RepID=A0ABY2SQD6_9HYPH|nr:EnvZ/OmpR regulon moderator MzrA [Martelella alba]TKI06939.1 EnvZ/OmpR regulon moderator MzrA [Martelella alba]